MKPSVVIIGSAGIDMVIKTDYLPAPLKFIFSQHPDY